jgi:cullin 3
LKETVNEDIDSTVPTAVEEERRHVLEAVIVRIMKSRKTLTHNQLLEEICRQVSNRFSPTPGSIKSRIESLIEREYLKRDDNDMRKYIYQA